MRLIDADELKDDFKYRLEKAKNWKENALNKGDDELVIRADAHIDFICEVIMTIDNAPTVERPQGEWIDTGSGQECSQCHEIQYGYDSFRHFCGNCGAKMEVKNEDPNK